MNVPTPLPFVVPEESKAPRVSAFIELLHELNELRHVQIRLERRGKEEPLPRRRAILAEASRLVDESIARIQHLLAWEG